MKWAEQIYTLNEENGTKRATFKKKQTCIICVFQCFTVDPCSATQLPARFLNKQNGNRFQPARNKPWIIYCFRPGGFIQNSAIRPEWRWALALGCLCLASLYVSQSSKQAAGLKKSLSSKIPQYFLSSLWRCLKPKSLLQPSDVIFRSRFLGFARGWFL